MIRRYVISVVTLLVLFTDWLYIFAITQNASIITHFEIISPLLMYLFICFNFAASIGIFLMHNWGFLISYLSIFSACGIAIYSYANVPSADEFNLNGLAALLFLNLAIFVYLIYFQIKANKRKHT